MPLVFYYDLMSQPCRAVYIFLKASGIPFESKEIALRKLEQTTEEFARINPFKKVPVIDDDGFILTERFDWRKKHRTNLFSFCDFSVAIFTYLCDKYKKYDWYPVDLQERARVNEYANWQHTNLRAMGSMLFREKVKHSKNYSSLKLNFHLADYATNNEQTTK